MPGWQTVWEEESRTGDKEKRSRGWCVLERKEYGKNMQLKMAEGEGKRRRVCGK